ncbi:Noranthrone synthase [Ascochyta rabiei]|uniref:Noranthrone synthase n=1 Tax=Didymella rabiei TaxID=5454 RepID=UPI002206A459|nr:Noranthrone synthase [Ascochyta rabiei]UPX21004.1 Noranthrone synthase [Ascochyta rabiei]
MALSKLWASWGVTPVAVIGHSLGEYAALNVSGVLSEAETIYVVGTRAALIEEKCEKDTRSMLVVKGSVQEIALVLRDCDYEVSCMNSPVETVLSGPNECISASKKILESSGLRSTLLRVPYAFHSSQIEHVMPFFEKTIEGITFSKPKVPILRPLDGKIDHEGDFDSKYLAAHAREPVNMLEALQTAQRQHLITEKTILIEIGQHPAVSGMVKAALGSNIKSLPSAERFRSVWQTITVALASLYHAGMEINWTEYQRDFQASQKVIALPAYSWNLKDYWIQYVNDWSLRKGDPPLRSNQMINLESTTIHRVIEETASSHRLHLIVEADIARTDLRPLVQGHEVDGIPLCTPSVYADISLNIGTYLLQKYRPTQAERVVDVSDMAISKALILRVDESQQLLQIHADVDWASQSTSIIFKSFDKSQKLQEHSRCVVRFKSEKFQQLLQHKAENIKKKMQILRDGVGPGMTARFNRSMVYRMISPLARFHNDYKAVDEIVLNSDTLEASCRLSFGSVRRGGKFHTHPAIIDALTQSCGFTMNCNDATDLDFQVYMNHGWSSFSIFEHLDFDKVYTTYTRMEQGANKLWHGDVTIFDGDNVVAFFGRIAIQGVPRKALKAILSIESGLQSKKQLQSSRTAVAPPETHFSEPPVTEAGRASRGYKSAAIKFTEAMSIIAEASGIDEAELTDDTAFADVGIDSLMGLTISACLRERLGLDIEFHSFIFDFPTVGDLKVHLESSAESPEDSETTSPSISGLNITTPSSDDSAASSGVDFQRVLEIISEESGVATADLTDDSEFADSGVDSLLSIVVTSRMQEELGLNITHESLFIECPTVLDLKLMLSSGLSSYDRSAIRVQTEPLAGTTNRLRPATVQCPVQNTTEKDLGARKEKIDQYIQKYSAGFSVPAPCHSSQLSHEPEKVVMVTGASGSLGANLVNHLTQLPDVKTVVCLNRENREEPYVRQQKSMRDKGIRFPERLKVKLCVIQTDSSKSMLGLGRAKYDELAGSVTHIVHSGWPMSAKRPLSGFESQFQVMRNLIDFSCNIAARRPNTFKVGFQMISSIGVVGRYELEDSKHRVMVPEARVKIESVLPNGYSEAKWGCEQMIANTLQQHPHRFRATVVRLGQIAGSRTSGYWNPMEHFGFLIKSSQTLNALPDVPGTAFWTTVDDIAATLSELVLADCTPYPVYHIENPAGQSWKTLNSILGTALNITNFIPFEEWVERVRAAPKQNNPASSLLNFLDDNYLRMSCGGLVLDVRCTLEHSSTLRAVGPVSEEVVRKYVHIWREIGFLS